MKLMSLIMHRPACHLTFSQWDEVCMTTSARPVPPAFGWLSLCRDSFLNILIDCHSCLVRWVQRFAKVHSDRVYLFMKKKNSQWVDWKGFATLLIIIVTLNKIRNLDHNIMSEIVLFTKITQGFTSMVDLCLCFCKHENVLCFTN